MAAFMGESCPRYDARVVADVSIAVGTQPGRGKVQRDTCDMTSDVAVMASRFARPRTGRPGLHLRFAATFRYLGDSLSVRTSNGRKWNVCGAAVEIVMRASLPDGLRAVNCLALEAGNSNKSAGLAVNS